MVEKLRQQISMLEQALEKNEWNLKCERRSSRILDLMIARMEIYKSIAYRQNLLIELQTADEPRVPMAA